MLMLCAATVALAAGAAEPKEPMSITVGSVVVAGSRVSLQAPAFVFVLDTAEGLRAVSWENRLTGRTIALMSTRDGKPHEVPNVGDICQATGTLAGQPAAWQPVLGARTYPSAWQAWRLPLPTAKAEQAFELTVIPKLTANTVLKWQAHFVVE